MAKPPRPKTPPVAHANQAIEIHYKIVRDEEFQQLLAEWSEIVYRHLASFPKAKALVTETLPDGAERTDIDATKISNL